MLTQADLSALSELRGVLDDGAAVIEGLGAVRPPAADEAGDAAVAAVLVRLCLAWGADHDLLASDLALLAAYVDAAREAFADVDARVITVEVGGSP